MSRKRRRRFKGKKKCNKPQPRLNPRAIAAAFIGRCVHTSGWSGHVDHKRLAETRAEVLRTKEWRGLPMLGDFWPIPKYSEESRCGLYAMFPNDRDSVLCGDDLVRWALWGPPKMWETAMALAKNNDEIGEAMRIVIFNLNRCDGIREHLASTGRWLPSDRISCGCGDICKETGWPKAGAAGDNAA